MHKVSFFITVNRLNGISNENPECLMDSNTILACMTQIRLFCCSFFCAMYFCVVHKGTFSNAFYLFSGFVICVVGFCLTIPFFLDLGPNGAQNAIECPICMPFFPSQLNNNLLSFSSCFQQRFMIFGAVYYVCVFFCCYFDTF